MRRRKRCCISPGASHAPRAMQRLRPRIAAMVLLLSGCAAAPTAAPEPPPARLPRLSDWSEAMTPQGAGELAVAKDAVIQVRVMQLDLPLKDDLEPAWTVLASQTNAIPSHLINLWRDNGLVLGVLNRATYTPFAEALPPPVSVRAVRSNTAIGAVTVKASPMLADSREFELDVEATRSNVRLQRGQCQFILRVEPAEGGRFAVSVVPHLHYNRHRIAPLSQLDRMFEGTTFEELQATAVIEPAEQFLVIGYSRPAAPAAPQAPAAPPDPPAVVEGEESPPIVEPLVARFKEAEPPAPTRLGRIWMTSRGTNTDLQLLFVIAVGKP